MSNQLFKTLEDAITLLDKEIVRQKEIRDIADDLDDWKKGQELSLKSYTNIRDLKAWRRSLESLSDEIKNSQLFSVQVQTEAAQASTNNDTADVSPPAQYTEIEKQDDHFDEKNNSEFYQQEASDSYISELVSSAFDNYNEIEDKSNSQFGADTVKGKDSFFSDIADDKTEWLTVDDDFRSQKITKFMFLGNVYYCKGLTDAMMKICDLMYLYDTNKFKELIYIELIKTNSRKFLSYSLRKDDSGRILNQKMNNVDVYVLTNISSNVKISYLSQLLKFFGISKNELKFAVDIDVKPEPGSVSALTPNLNEKAKDNAVEFPLLDRPVVFVLYERRYMAKGGKEFVVRFSEAMILHHPFQMALAAKYLSGYFYDNINSGDSQDKVKLSNGLWVKVSDSPNHVGNLISDVLNHCKAPEKAFKLEVQHGC